MKLSKGIEEQESSLFNGLWVKSRLILMSQEDARFDNPNILLKTTSQVKMTVDKSGWLVAAGYL